jgi:pimeloyl-ACP methyl ester carboxylesterase
MLPDTEGLHRIANTDQHDRVADVVFVHGLGGNHRTTWLHSSEVAAETFFWPAELGTELPQCGVWSLGYEAGMIPWFGSDGMPIPDRAVSTAHRLLNHGLGTRPILFICHSMGGLVVKEIIAQASEHSGTDLRPIAAKVCGIVFCGTPHQGATLATVMKNLRAVLRTQEHLKGMGKGNRTLRDLHQNFAAWHHTTKVPVITYLEGVGMGRKHWWLRWLPKLIIVDEDTGDPKLGRKPIVCHEDHSTLVKPSHRQHDVYAGTRRFIEGCLPLSKDSPRSSNSEQPSTKLIISLWEFGDISIEILPRHSTKH